MIFFSSGCRYFQGTEAPRTRKKVIVLGIDGMDPLLLERYIAAGKMPNFANLAAISGVHRLGTSTPPQSPVAWSNLTTGMDPGGHGIFDFIHRDPRTMEPYLSTSKVEPSRHSVRLGSWIIPLSSGKTELLRHGRAFWEYLDDHGIPALIYRMPANFPPVQTKARSLSGMGTPDLLGTYGTFSYYTDDLFVPAGAVNGGHVYPVRVENSGLAAKLHGPYNSLRNGEPQAAVDFRVALDPVEPVVKISLPSREFILREGEWSGWVQVNFELLPHLASTTGICKFYLKQVRPQFQLYVTPLNLDPSRPALPISTPADYSRELWEELGFFYTQGIAEDTRALSGGYLNDSEYLVQARMVLDEQMRAYDRELKRFDSGLFFFYFSSLDLNSHMFWRAIDEHHPGYSAETAQKFGNVLEDLYVEMDRALGKAIQKSDAETTLVVLSDHGFAPYYRSFNLNAWLADNGYLVLKEGATRGKGDFFAGVDWSRTRAYGLGLNALYINLRGRERGGIVATGEEAEKLRAEIARRLLEFRDPAGDAPVIGRVDRSAQIYHGAYAAEAPDLLIGYNRGYRAGWGTVLGGISTQVMEDNLDAWSGDHCMDPNQVPGVLLTNRAISGGAASLIDIAPTLLAEFGLAKPAGMAGRPLFGDGADAPR
jgi:predicted AlkP superfamily phosphohydrolase/phosphomutase